MIDKLMQAMKAWRASKPVTAEQIDQAAATLIRRNMEVYPTRNGVIQHTFYACSIGDKYVGSWAITVTPIAEKDS